MHRGSATSGPARKTGFGKRYATARSTGTFRFQHTLWPSVADFACLEAMSIVEIDGGQHMEEADRQRTAHLEVQGYQVLRFWNNDVSTNIDGVVEVLRSTLAGRTKKKTLPNPSRESGRG